MYKFEMSMHHNSPIEKLRIRGVSMNTCLIKLKMLERVIMESAITIIPIAENWR